MDFGTRSVWLRKTRREKCEAADHYIQSHEAEGREEFGAGYRIQGPFWSKYFWLSVTSLGFHRLPKMYHQLRDKIWNPQVDEAYFTLKPQQLWKDIDRHLQNRLFCGNTHWNPLQRWLLSGVWVEQKYLHFLYPLRAAYLYTCSLNVRLISFPIMLFFWSKLHFLWHVSTLTSHFKHGPVPRTLTMPHTEFYSVSTNNLVCCHWIRSYSTF